MRPIYVSVLFTSWVDWVTFGMCIDYCAHALVTSLIATSAFKNTEFLSDIQRVVSYPSDHQMNIQDKFTSQSTM